MREGGDAIRKDKRVKGKGWEWMESEGKMLKGEEEDRGKGKEIDRQGKERETTIKSKVEKGERKKEKNVHI